MSALNDDLLLRYSRQIFLPDVDVDGQERLLSSHVLIMGVGGLGSLSAAYLAGAGIGKLTLVDDDKVDITNLHRQLLFAEHDVGILKVKAAKQRLMSINQNCDIHIISDRLSQKQLEELLFDVDLLLDGTDNFESRLMINRACHRLKKPLLTAAVTQFSGQLSLFDFAEQTPCYQCLYPKVDEVENNCAENGVLGPSAGIMASWQALHAMKYLLGIRVESLHQLMLIDMLGGKSRNIAIQADPNCKLCCQ